MGDMKDAQALSTCEFKNDEARAEWESNTTPAETTDPYYARIIRAIIRVLRIGGRP